MINVYHPKVTRSTLADRGCFRGNQLQKSDHNKVQEQSYQGQRPYISWVQRDALVMQSLAQLMTTLTM